MARMSLQDAEQIVKTKSRFLRMTEKLDLYSYKKGDGKSWSIGKLGDSHHFDAKRLINDLSDEDRAAINRYIVGKIKKTIRTDKEFLESIGVNVKELKDE